MLTKNRRGNLVWVAFIVFAMLLFVGNGALEALLFTVGIVMFMLAVASARQIKFPQPQRATTAKEMTAAARAARLHSSDRPDYDDYYALRDIGMIIDEQDQHGLSIRRARTLSMDDRAVRPYVVVSAPHDGRHPDQVLVRFEMTDANGASQFIYEMEYYMRPGENAILPDYRLPLKNNQRLGRAGQWDLQVWINGGLLGVHAFTMNPSHEIRRIQFTAEGEARGKLMLDEDPIPVSLEELLAQQHQSASN